MDFLDTHNRPRLLEALKTTDYDLIVIGGGITGGGIALDAASRGMKVALLEKEDFASGTSGKSTKLIHGGLRYLKQFEIALVREYGRERAVVNRLAPHLVRSEKMLLPLIKGGSYGKMMTSMGLMVYDVLAGVEKADQRMMLSVEQTQRLEPLLPVERLEGGGLYSEYRTDDSRLTIEVVKTAAKYGCHSVNYVEAEDFLYEEGKVSGVKCHDHFLGQPLEIKGKMVVNAAGPWVDLIRKKNNSVQGKHLQHSKGVHIVLPHQKIPIKQAIYFDVPGGRMIFAIPRGNMAYVGTTDTPYFGRAEDVKAMREDVDYLLMAVNYAFPSLNLKVEDVVSSWAGVRPLIQEAGKSTSDLSRKDEMFESETGLLTIAGGKLTGYRKMADRVVTRVAKKLESQYDLQFKKCRTHKISLKGANFRDSMHVDQYIHKLEARLTEMGHYPGTAEYLVCNYGKQTKKIIRQMIEFMENNPRIGLIRAEVWFCIHHELCTSPADFYIRRSGRLYFNIESVGKYLDYVIADFAEHFDWSIERMEAETEKVKELIKSVSHFEYSPKGKETEDRAVTEPGNTPAG